MDFDAFWVTVSRLAVPAMLEKLGADGTLADTLYNALGITGDTTDIDGVLCWGTYDQMGAAMHEVLQAAGVHCDKEEVMRMTKDLYHQYAEEGSIRPACADLTGVLGSHIHRDRIRSCQYRDRQMVHTIRRCR